MAIAFVDGAVVVGDGRVLEHATVLVEGERIVKVAEGNVSIPKDAQKIPLEGQILLPGFIDSHVHICFDCSPDPMTSASSESQTMTTLKAANIEAGTRIAAQVLGLEKELGTVEEGKLADLILIEGNPLEDIEILAKRELIRLVMKDGKQVSGKFF